MYCKRIDIPTELAAAARGECLSCRISARHADDSACLRAGEWARFHCAHGRHDVNRSTQTCKTCGRFS